MSKRARLVALVSAAVLAAVSQGAVAASAAARSDPYRLTPRSAHLAQVVVPTRGAC